MKTGPELLHHYEDHWETGMGAWFPGERVVYRGKDLLNECRNFSWLKLLVFGVVGRELSDEEMQLLEATWVLCASFPDPRLWNNRVAALAGTARSSASLAIAAATAVSEARTYGRRADIRASTFLYQLAEHMGTGGCLESFVDNELRRSRSLPGFGRPVTSVDERIEPLLERARELGLAGGSYLQLAYKVQDYLTRTRKRLKMNVAIVTAALLADIGLSPREYYLCAVLCFSAGMFPCYLDTSRRPEGAFLPLSTNRLNYTGAPVRQWGRPCENSNA